MLKPLTRLIIIALLAMGFLSASAQSKFAVTLLGSINNSDMNYGSEFIEQLLPVSDYDGVLFGGSGAFGFDIGAGVSYHVADKVAIPFSVYYGNYGYKVEGQLVDFDPPNNRPPDPALIREADGKVNYKFVGIQTGATYLFSDNVREGFNLSILIDYMFLSGTSWNLDVVYEDDRTGEYDDDFILEAAELNNIFTLGIKMGYRIPVGESYTLEPRFQFRGGLNSISGDTIKPAFFELGITVYRWM